MLLPSALPCDSSQTPRLTRLQSALFASPPASPPHLSTQQAIGNIFSTCRSLQSLLAGPAPPANTGPEPITPPTSSRSQLLTPPLACAPPPLKLRLRSRKTDSTTGDHGPARKRIVKRSAAVAQAPRGPNKRRRAADDDMGRCSEDDSDTEQHGPLGNPVEGQDKENEARSGPQTPKRSRLAPEVIPLGLERSDYHNLHHSFPQNVPTDGSSEYRQDGTDVVVEADGEAWSTEEDRILVELVLEKLKLTKSDWQDCARSLGKDRGSVGRRWKSLMINGEVGLKRGSHRRGRIHGTWR
ncbi:uncharacterized protein B0T15DRAFT_35132 [Chaetomium strumarium]|uniref:Myb-like domain-containing protein n=1 Tax=Chaetomium strumarium TaxID=1170767 RepID=A0AAJ0H1Z3_9PEZI|nr:hypothetical protein B0T15DRAFT_35132 [Chaetomium strumarium]